MKDEDFEFAPSNQATALERFATHLHQDVDLEFATFSDALSAYMSGIDSSEKIALKDNIRTVLHRIDNNIDLRNYLIKIGAHNTYPADDIRRAMETALKSQ